MSSGPYQFFDALGGLVRGVRAYFDANGIAAKVSAGWTARYRQDNQGPGGASRVVFVPGDFDPGGGPPKVLDGGEIDRDGAMNQIGLNPSLRTLAWHHAVYTACVWGVHPEKPQDEEAQLWATKALLHRTVRAMHLAVDPETGQGAGFGNIESWGKLRYTLPPGEMGYGREAVFRFVLLEPLFDQEIEQAFPDAVVTRGGTTAIPGWEPPA
jgi:hypothetical protein